MTLTLLAWLYATVGLIVAGYVYFRAVVLRPVPKQFEAEDTAVLTLAAFLVGVIWPVFVPALLALWGLQAARWIEARLPWLTIRHSGGVGIRG